MDLCNIKICKNIHPFLNTLPISTAINDAKTFEFIYVNDEFTRQSGYSREEVIGKTVDEIGAWPIESEIEKINYLITENGGVQNELVHIIKKTSDIITVMFSAKIIKYNEKDCIISYAIDVTETLHLDKKKELMELAIKYSLELNSMITDYTEKEIIQCGLDKLKEITKSKIGYFHFVDEDTGELTLTAWSKGTMEKCPLANSDNDPTNTHYSISEAGIWVDAFYKRNPVIHNDYNNEPHKKGLPKGHVPVTRDLSVPIKDDKGKIKAILGVGNKPTDYDKTDIQVTLLIAENIWRTIIIKQKESKIKKEQEKSKNYFELSPNLTIILDNVGNVVNINDNGCKILGISDKNDIIGKSWFDNFLPDNNKEILHKSFVKVMNNKRTNEEEFPNGIVNEIKTLSGEIKKIEWYNSLLHKNEEIKYQYSTGIDITEKINLEEQLRQSAKLESIGKLAGGIAHDFNNILTVMGGFADILLKRNLDNYTRDKLEKILSSSKRAEKLTNQLLAFGRKQILNPSILNVNDIIKNEQDFYDRLIRETIEIQYKLSSYVSNVYIDKLQLQNVLMNIILNARDAITGYGNIVIETNNVHFDKNSGDVIRNKIKPGDYVKISITDDGCGMSEETKKKIFEPFFTTKKVGKGTGLGLATVYGTIKQSNGYIFLDSRLNEGTTFDLYFPMSDEKVDDKSKKPNKASYKNVSGKTILIAEDESKVQELVKEVLVSNGYKVYIAKNGYFALKISKELNHKIDLLLTDVIMPKMDGHELATKLMEQIPNLKVLYMSGYTDNTVIQNGVFDDDVDFIQKPIYPDDLLEKISEIFNK